MVWEAYLALVKCVRDSCQALPKLWAVGAVKDP